MAKTTSVPFLNHFLDLSTIALWNSNIKRAINEGETYRAFLLFRQLKEKGLEPNNLTFPLVAKACGKISKILYSQMFHAHVVKSPFQFDKYVQTAFVDMYVKCDRLDYACNLFDEMSERDVTSWNAMLVGFAELGLFDKVSALFYQMRLDKIRPDLVTVMGLTKLCSGLKDLKLMNAIHGFGIRSGVQGDVSVANTWIAAYSKCSDLGMAEMLFGGIDTHFRTVVSFNSMLSGYAYLGESSKAISLFKRMLLQGFCPDVSTILNLLSSCVRAEALCHGKSVHCHGIQVGCVSNISVLNSTISMYSKCGEINSARLLFNSMLDRNCVSWTAIIGGYAERGDLEEALTLFHSMKAAGQKPDLVTVVYIVLGCGQTGAFEFGRWIDNYITSNGLKDNVMVCNALIDMYAKCGSIKDAWEVFHTMPERTIVSWTAMIAGCALNGEFKEALELFFLMLDTGLRPNHITFLAVLQACTHAGFLEKGWDCFNMMTKLYKINPGIDHYSCMVDLLGRRGKLKEALEFIDKMPIKPDAGIWGTLLSACKNHHNLEIAEYAANHLFKLEPQAAAPYVEMANLYASAGKWDEVAITRTMMRGNQVVKSPGQSLVQVNGKFHAFTVEDKGHPEGILIYEVLHGLALQLTREKDSPLSGEFFC